MSEATIKNHAAFIWSVADLLRGPMVHLFPRSFVHWNNDRRLSDVFQRAGTGWR